MTTRLSTLLKEARKALKLRQIDVARVLGVNVMTVFNYENAKVAPRMGRLGNIAKAYRLDIAEVVQAYTDDGSLTEQPEIKRLRRDFTRVSEGMEKLERDLGLSIRELETPE